MLMVVLSEWLDWESLLSFTLLWIIFVVDKKILKESETLKPAENEPDSFGHGLKYICPPVPLQKTQVAVLTLVLYCILKIYFTWVIINLKEARYFKVAEFNFPAEEGTYAISLSVGTTLSEVSCCARRSSTPCCFSLRKSRCI